MILSIITLLLIMCINKINSTDVLHVLGWGPRDCARRLDIIVKSIVA